MPDSVHVTVPARLHLGFLDLNGGLGRRFGSIGLAIEGLRTRIELSRAPADSVTGPESARAGAYLQQIRAALGLRAFHRLSVGEAIPAHAGLGSGTQLALAVAAAVRRLHGAPQDPRSDARVLGRGARSGVGIGLFTEGGLVLDGGRSARDEPPPILARLPFPEAWRIVLVLDRHATGVHGPDEAEAFAALPPMPADVAAHLCRLALMRALPALAEADLDPFGRAVTEIQAVIGDQFAPAQGGRFASPGVAAALERLERAGCTGFGQSSWGPTGFAFAPSEATAAEWAALLRDLAASAGLTVLVVRGRNAGAEIQQINALTKAKQHG
ncbi:beta-ribofuranosylaminobenzene 5'-phosphate synthase family protein [Faunimonas sp. B44]|uniref:beta-ribofuranosylaminobenzene 5'-phosphate synthase family protein n=1 Tax=Faunimonas sp. B44 TaxID=3461493 RepID=UPI0040443BB7